MRTYILEILNNHSRNTSYTGWAKSEATFAVLPAHILRELGSQTEIPVRFKRKLFPNRKQQNKGINKN